jgi:RimJ/RimL family protein N-acetyltransferase
MVAMLRDGTTVRVRPVRPGDGPALRALLGRLSPRSRRLRFFDAGADLDRKAGWAASQGAGRGLGLVATLGSPERVVGHAAYVRDGSRAEIAFEVEEALQGRGLGGVLLAQLAAAAQRAGVRTLTAIVHPANRRMVALLHGCGLPLTESRRPGRLLFTLRLGGSAR